MAIYHLHVKVSSRSSGANAIAASAYRACEKIGENDYSPRKSQLDFQEIYAPENSPEWCTNRKELWTRVEASEKRKDAQLFRELNIAIPLELKESERRDLIKKFSSEFVKLGMIADATIHKGKNGQNPHAHIMLTTREIIPDGFGKKCRDWNNRDLLEHWREKWAELANESLERAGQNSRIDHRTLKAQGIDREPTFHQGKNITHAKQPTIIRQLNDKIREVAHNAQEMAQIRLELNELTQYTQNEQMAVTRPLRAFQGDKNSGLPPVKQTTRQFLREEDKADEQQSKQIWEDAQKGTREWEADEKILTMASDPRGTEAAHTQKIIAYNAAKAQLESYKENLEHMGKLAKLAKRGEIKATLAALQEKIERTDEEMRKIGAISLSNKQLEFKKSDIHQKRLRMWENSPEGTAFKSRHEERRKKILELEKEERERTRTRGQSLGWSR